MSNAFRSHIDEVINFQQTSLEYGLTTNEIDKRKQIHGFNKLEPPEKVSF